MRPLAWLPLLTVLAACGAPDDARPVSDTELRFRLDDYARHGFWASPWPSDHRVIEARRAGGAHPDLWDFPNPSGEDRLESFILFGSTVIEGFGINSPVAFSFDGRVALGDPDEADTEASQACEGPVRIVDVDPDSPEQGRCIPARWRALDDDGDVDPWLDPHMVMVAPYWGFPLRSATTYAVYLQDVQDPAGAFLQPPEALRELLLGTSSDADMQAVYQPLTDYLAAVQPADADLEADWIAAATVFTTQDVITPMQALADRVRSDPDLPRWNVEEGLTLLDPEHPEYQHEYDLYDGSYTALNFQEGTIPYEREGGGFVWEDGEPVPQFEERIPFVIGTPLASYTQPAEGWPVIIHAHGTGGDRFSHLTGGNLRPGLMGAARGFLSIGIPQPIHEERWPGGNELGVSLWSFNYFNPPSGVSMFRQGALDTIALVRFLEENLTEGGAIADAFPELRIDPDNIYFVGHSQGGLTGSLALPFTEGINGWVLSGAGAGLSMTLMQRQDPFVIRDALLTGVGAPDGVELFEMHPLIGLVQSLAERTDPLNYAPLWVDRSDGQPVSVLLTEGLHDAQTPADTSEALAIAGGLPIIEGFHERDVFGLELRGFDVEDTPYAGNVDHTDGTPVTTGLAQFDSNHFAIFNESSAGILWANFLYSVVRDGAPGEIGGSFP